MDQFKKFVPDVIEKEKMHIVFVYNIDIESMDCIKAFFMFSKSRIAHYKKNSKFDGYSFENVLDVRGQPLTHMGTINDFMAEMNREANIQFRLIS